MSNPFDQFAADFQAALPAGAPGAAPPAPAPGSSPFDNGGSIMAQPPQPKQSVMNPPIMNSPGAPPMGGGYGGPQGGYGQQPVYGMPPLQQQPPMMNGMDGMGNMSSQRSLGMGSQPGGMAPQQLQPGLQPPMANGMDGMGNMSSQRSLGMGSQPGGMAPQQQQPGLGSFGGFDPTPSSNSMAPPLSPGRGGSFGQPPADAGNPFGGPAPQQSSAYGAPPPPSDQSYGGFSGDQGRGQPPSDPGFGSPPPPPGQQPGFDGAYGGPPPGQQLGGYPGGPPPPSEQSFGGQPPGQQLPSYGAPPPPSEQGYGAPPGQQLGYGQGPPPPSNDPWGAPDYGAPPPQQQGGYPGNGPYGSSYGAPPQPGGGSYPDPWGDPNARALVPAQQQSNPYAVYGPPPGQQSQAIQPYGGPPPTDPFSVFEQQQAPPPAASPAPPAAPPQQLQGPPPSNDDLWGDLGFSAPPSAQLKSALPEASTEEQSGGHSDEKKTGDGSLPPGGEYYDARIFTPTLGVMFFKPQELTDSLFLNTDQEIVDGLAERPVVAFIVEGSSARAAGVELGHVLLKVNGTEVKNPKEASRLIKEGPRPLPLLFYVPNTDVVVAEGEHMVKYDTRETTAPNSAKDWKPKYVVIGGIIAQPWMMNMYRSKSEYDIAVIETQARRPVSVKVKQFSMQGARIQNDWQGPQMVKYKNKIHPWKYIVVLPVARNPIKISSPNLAQLKPVHEGIRRVLLAQNRDRSAPSRRHDGGYDRGHDQRTHEQQIQQYNGVPPQQQQYRY